MSEFNLADFLKNVPKADTSGQIVKISLDLIDDDPRNDFYSIRGIEELAANIQTVGLLDPVILREHPEAEGRYILVSGHRRRAAYKLLAAENAEYQEIPAIIQAEAGSPALQELRLIYANAHNRTRTSAEISEETARITELLYQLQAEGMEFPGRMRDHVAEACQISKTKYARLKVIRDKLSPAWASLYKAGKLNEAMAYVLAQQSAEWQEVIYQAQVTPESIINLLSVGHLEACIREMRRVSGLTIDGQCNTCTHQSRMVERAAKIRNAWVGINCRGCCFSCNSLETCKDCCPDAKGKKAELRATAKQTERDAEARQAERDAPYVAHVTKIYQRVADRLDDLGMDVESYKISGSIPQYSSVSLYLPETFSGKREIRKESYLPFGNMLQATDAQYLIKAADTLQCSLDWLLGRTETVEMAETVKPEPAALRWQTGTPEQDGTYIGLVYEGYPVPSVYDLTFKDGMWRDTFLTDRDRIVGWLPMPEDPEVAVE